MEVGQRAMHEGLRRYSSIGPLTWFGHEALEANRPANGD